MKIRNKSLRVISYVLLGVITLLFLLFILTYDLSVHKDSETIDRKEFQSEIDEIIASAISESKIDNVINFSLDEKVLNSALNIALLDRNEDLNVSEYWELKDLEINFLNNEILIDIYADFSYRFNYKMHIRAFFQLTENGETYVLDLTKIKVGSIYIPSFLVKNVLGNSDDMSLGTIVRDAMSSLPFGSFDYENLSYTIYKSSIAYSVSNGTIGDLFFDENALYKNALSSYLKTIFDNNLANITINNAFNISLNYSKIINSQTTINSMNIVDEDISEVISSRYSIIFKHLLSNSETVSFDKDSQNLILRCALNNAIPTDANTYLVSTYGSALSFYENKMYFEVVFEIENIYSIVRYCFTNELGLTYHLDKVQIGKDNNESEGSFISIESNRDLNIYLSILSLIGADVDLVTNNISTTFIIDYLGIPYQNYTLDENNITLYAKNNYSDLIKTALSDDSLNLTENEKLCINTSDYDETINNLSSLTYMEKRDVLIKLRDYYQEIDNEVYNYIDSLIILED